MTMRFMIGTYTEDVRKAGVLLWIVQGLLALIYLLMKLVLPPEMLTEQTPLPGLFLRFVGVAEVLGAIGLILPGARAFGRT